MTYHPDFEAFKKLQAEYEARISEPLQSCPLCGSSQIQLCADFNNPAKDVCRCRDCKCSGPRTMWQRPRIPVLPLGPFGPKPPAHTD